MFGGRSPGALFTVKGFRLWTNKPKYSLAGNYELANEEPRLDGSDESHLARSWLPRWPRHLCVQRRDDRCQAARDIRLDRAPGRAVYREEFPPMDWQASVCARRARTAARQAEAFVESYLMGDGAAYLALRRERTYAGFDQTTRLAPDLRQLIAPASESG